jgi:hypothetical protein
MITSKTRVNKNNKNNKENTCPSRTTASTTASTTALKTNAVSQGGILSALAETTDGRDPNAVHQYLLSSPDAVGRENEVLTSIHHAKVQAVDFKRADYRYEKQRTGACMCCHTYLSSNSYLESNTVDLIFIASNILFNCLSTCMYVYNELLWSIKRKPSSTKRLKVAATM